MYWNHSFITTFQQIFTFKKTCPHFFCHPFSSTLLWMNCWCRLLGMGCIFNGWSRSRKDPGFIICLHARARTNITTIHGALTKQCMSTNTSLIRRETLRERHLLREGGGGHWQVWNDNETAAILTCPLWGRGPLIDHTRIRLCGGRSFIKNNL